MLEIGTGMGTAQVKVTSGRGLSPEEIAEMCVEGMVHIADTAHPAIRQQMNDLKPLMKQRIARAIKQGIRSDRTTIYNMLHKAGYPTLAEAVVRGRT